MSLVYNTNISKTEYLVDLEDNGKAKQTALLSMSSTAPSGEFKKGSQYYNSTDKKIYTAVEDNVWGTTGKDPNFGVIYQCDNEYYVWDGDNLITTDLEGYEKLVNKATNFNTVNNTKYPTTKAVADYVVKESIVRNFTDAGITKTTSSDVFSDRTNNTGLAEEILAKQFPTGTTLYGEVRNQGMPTGIGNAEIRVEILETKSNGAQVIEFTLFSVDIEPKEWSHIYFSARTEQQNPWVWIPKAVPTDDYTSNATTTVPTSKALSDSLLLKQDISNKSDDFTEDSSIKYPSSKALSDGLKSVEPNLYDIKTLSQAVVNKGWALTCKDTRQDLLKADVPTVYDDILTKYRNCDNAPSSSYVQLLNDCSYNCFCFDDTYIYGTINPNNNPNLKRSLISIFPSISWEQTPISMYINSPTTNNRRLAIGDNLIVTHNERDYDNGKEIIHIYKKSDFSLHKSIEIKMGKNSWIYLLNIDGVKTFYIFYPNIDDNNYTLVTLVDSETTEFDTIRTDLTGGIGLPVYDNGIFTFYYDGDKYISKSNDNFRTITPISNFDYSYSHSTLRDIFKIGNNMVCTCGNGRLSGTKYSTDNGQTWNYYTGLPFSEINNSAWCDGETFYGCCFDDSYYTHLYKSTDLINFTKLIPSERTGSDTLTISILDNPSTIFIQNQYDVKYLGIIKTVYTDTYTVNGVNVNINYYKYDDWKICIPNGTNDTNLDTVYNFLGYLNYWRLNETNETITLPRNSNLYSMMYVGDNYQDIVSGLPNSEYIPYQTKNIILTNISASTWNASITYPDYAYECTISCSNITANSFVQIIFAPTEADSGNYATVCNTGNGTVTIYSKVNDTITIPSIVVMGV